jgi:hypothetical protein
MGFAPRRSPFSRKLYRNRMLAVTLAAIGMAMADIATIGIAMIGLASPPLAAQAFPQYGRKPAADKGPRALGLVQLAPKGKARFTPIAIMVDGKFFDAGSYKAAPVPMALDFGTVYEAFHSGVSLGIFTISQPGQLNHVWIAEGTWLPAGAIDPSKHKKYSTPVIADDDKDGPPVLHRRTEKSDSDSSSAAKDTDKDKSKSEDSQKPTTPATPTTAAPAAGAPSSPDAPKTPSPEPAKPAAAPAAPDAAAEEPIQDPNRPRLRRGKPDATEHHEPFTTFDALTGAVPGSTPAADKTGAAKDSAVAPPQLVVLPAISDAGGPDPRPYTFDVKPSEEAIYRDKMIALATAQLGTQTKAAAKETANKKTAVSKSTGKSAAKTTVPAFDDISLRIFDLSNSNEPVLILSAKTHSSVASATGNVETPPTEITLIARTNLEGELKKLFFSQTDARHLDVSPRMELIDAVDADGDGRGELLFRRTFDDGSAYAIYRVTADRLWTLFEGTP